MTLPNFLIIGAAKAGTTTLYEHLRSHPEVFMPRFKEPRFFGFPGEGPRGKFPVQTLEEYEALFAEAGEARAIGEATPHYLRDPGAAERIHALIPGARLIASLRNPVDRAYSVYQMNQRNRDHNAEVPFVEAMRRDHNLQETYAENLGRFFALFPRERIHVLLLEDLEAAPRRTMREIFGFLGVDPAFEPDLSRVANPGGEPRSRILHRMLTDRRLAAVSRRLLPERAVEPLKALRSRNLAKRPLGAAERATAASYFREDILRTQELIGRDLSHWLDGRDAA
jgi:hypothetical protein